MSDHAFRGIDRRGVVNLGLKKNMTYLVPIKKQGVRSDSFGFEVLSTEPG